MRLIPSYVAVAALVFTGAAYARPPKHPLQGQTLDFIASSSGDDADTLRLTVNSVVIANPYGGDNSRGEADMESDAGKDAIAFIRATGRKVADAKVLPDKPGQVVGATAPYSFFLTMTEHVVYRMGDNVGAAFVAGLTFGLSAKSTIPVTFVSELALDVRADGVKETFNCAARVKADAPRDLRPRPEVWTPIITSARYQCTTDLIDKMKADTSFFNA